MKALRTAAGFALVIMVAACGGTDEGADGPSMPDVVGQQLDVALGGIEEAGFEEDVDIVGGGTFGVIDESNWTVCEQSPAAGRPIAATPELTVDRSCDEDAPSSSAPTSEPAPSMAPAPSAPPTTAAEEVLTAANNPDFAAILADPNNCSDAIESFAATYAGRTIEFDGNVADIALEGDYDTRYRWLIYPGNYSETSASGPSFQFRDIGIGDLSIAGPELPDSVSAGLNIRVVARIQSYEAMSCLFLIEPISIAPR